MSYRHHFISFTMLGLLAFVTWTFMSSRSQPISVITNSFPDVIMEDVSALIMDKQGKPTMKIVAPKMKHYTKDDATDLTDPTLTIYRNGTAPWYITAETARSLHGIDHVTLSENVLIQHAADINSPATIIKTTLLRVHSKDQTAETNEPIALIQPNITVNAIGMHANMSNGDIQLLSAARGVYAPKQ